jgi:hypothetical protein
MEGGGGWRDGDLEGDGDVRACVRAWLCACAAAWVTRIVRNRNFILYTNMHPSNPPNPPDAQPVEPVEPVLTLGAGEAALEAHEACMGSLSYVCTGTK